MSSTIERIHTAVVTVPKANHRIGQLKLRLCCEQKLSYPSVSSAAFEDPADLEVMLDRSCLHLIISFYWLYHHLLIFLVFFIFITLATFTLTFLLLRN
jgi:hypothetical protein